jgi:hypothetical protein
MVPQEIIENVVGATNQSKGSVLAVLSELDVQITAGLKAGRIVRLPNGTRFEPVGKDFDGATIQVPQGTNHVPGLADALTNPKIIKPPSKAEG